MFADPRSASFRPLRTGFYDGYLDALLSLGALSEEAVLLLGYEARRLSLASLRLSPLKFLSVRASFPVDLSFSGRLCVFWYSPADDAGFADIDASLRDFVLDQDIHRRKWVQRRVEDLFEVPDTLESIVSETVTQFIVVGVPLAREGNAAPKSPVWCRILRESVLLVFFQQFLWFSSRSWSCAPRPGTLFGVSPTGRHAFTDRGRKLRSRNRPLGLSSHCYCIVVASSRHIRGVESSLWRVDLPVARLSYSGTACLKSTVILTVAAKCCRCAEAFSQIFTVDAKRVAASTLPAAHIFEELNYEGLGCATRKN